MTPRNQIFHNAIFNTASWIFAVVVSFIFVPYIVLKMGADGYGVLVLVLSVMGYFAVLDLNLGDAVIKYVAEYHAGNNMKKVNEVVGSVILIYLALGIFGGACLLIFSDAIVTRLLKIRLEQQAAAQFAFMVGSIGVLFTMLLSVLSAIPNGLNRYDITSKATMVMGLSTTAGTVVLLYLGMGLGEIVVLNLVISLLGILFFAFASKRLLPDLVLRPSFNRGAISTVLRFGMYSMMSRLSGILQFQGVRLLAGAVLGVSSVTYYVVPFNLVSKAMAITFRLGGVIFPVISGMQGKQDFDSVTSLYLKSSRLIFSISTAIVLPLLLFGDRFLGLWMGGQFKQHTGIVMLLLTLSLFLDACTNVPSNVLNGLGMPKICGYFSISNAIINLCLAWPLSKLFDVNGIAMSFLIGQIIIAPIFVFYVNSLVLKLPITRLIREAYLLPLVAGGITSLVSFVITVKIETYSMVSLLGIMFVTSVLYVLVANCIGVFSKEEIGLLASYLRIGRKGAANNAG